METSNTPDLNIVSPEQASGNNPEQSPTASIPAEAVIPAQAGTPDKVQLQSMLSESRNTKLVLEEFDTAIKSGTFQGHQMIALAKGCSFLSALIGQTKAHIESIQQKLAIK